MKFAVLVNDAERIQPTQTTAMLIEAIVKLGYSVWVTGVGDLSCRPDGQVRARARQVGFQQTTSDDNSRIELVRAIASAPPESIGLGTLDALLIRTNPARDLGRAPLHNAVLALARQCQERGVLVLNHPEGLVRASSKLYLLELPQFVRPLTLVSQSPEEIYSFIERLPGAAVLKPLQGTRGNDVFFVNSARDVNLNQIIEVLQRQGLVMVQACIPEAEKGDTRVVVMNGRVLSVDGHAAAIRRVPGQGEIRSNLHAGGSAQPGIVTDEMEAAIAAIGPKLVSDGLFLVGLDFIGNQLLEINAFSTGGLRDAERFEGVAFAEAVIRNVARNLIGDRPPSNRPSYPTPSNCE